MIKSQYDIIIAGAGLAGLGAAQTLTGHGLDILIIDENRHIGGQLLRTTTPGQWVHPFKLSDPIKTKGLDLITTLNRAKDVHWLNRTEITGIFQGKQLLLRQLDSGTCIEVRARHLILATGARERYLPFKGWTLPNVTSLGAAQILMKSHGVLPATSTLLGGSSPLMMAVADQIFSAKGKVAGLVDEKRLKDKLKFIPLAPWHKSKLVQGSWYTTRTLLKRVKTFGGYRIVEAGGKNRFESAVIMKTDHKGMPIPGTEKTVAADALAVGYGFVPNIELGVQAGCALTYTENLGGWTIKTDPGLETSCRNIFAAGELTGIGGGEKSLIQGRICGLSILERLYKITKKQKVAHRREMKALKEKEKHQNAYAAFFNDLTRLPACAWEQIPDDTIICRCEEITMGLIRKQISQGFTTIPALKKAGRAGMGRCQGRICGPVISDIITALTRQSPEKTGIALSRAPVKNIPVETLLGSSV